jgi:hypothetical protein
VDKYPLNNLAYIAANLVGVILFSLHDSNPTAYSDSEMSDYTKIGFVVNWINAFIIQWILIYVPYHW